MPHKAEFAVDAQLLPASHCSAGFDRECVDSSLAAAAATAAAAAGAARNGSLLSNWSSAGIGGGGGDEIEGVAGINSSFSFGGLPGPGAPMAPNSVRKIFFCCFFESESQSRYWSEG